MSIFRNLVSAHGSRHGHGHGHGHGHDRSHDPTGQYAPCSSSENTVPPTRGCPHCQSPNNTDARFCNICGGALIAWCRNCQQAVSPKAIYCGKCGTAVATASAE